MAQNMAWTWATQVSQRVADFDYIDGSIILQMKAGYMYLAERKNGKYVYSGEWFFLSDCNEFWQALTEILLGIRKPSPIPPMDIHEQAHDDW